MKTKFRYSLCVLVCSGLLNSCCGLLTFDYEVLIKSSNNYPINVIYTSDFGKTKTLTLTDFPSYNYFGYIVKCDEVIPQIKVYNNNSVLRVLIVDEASITVDNVNYYSLGDLYEKERIGEIPPITTDSVMDYYKNTNNPNYMELSATEISKILVLKE